MLNCPKEDSSRLDSPSYHEHLALYSSYYTSHFACQKNGVVARTSGLVANHETVYIQGHDSGDSVNR